LLAEAGKTIIFVTHSLAEACFCRSDRADDGKAGAYQSHHPCRRGASAMPAFMLQPRFSELRNQCYAALHDEIREALATAERGESLGDEGNLYLSARAISLPFLQV